MSLTKNLGGRIEVKEVFLGEGRGYDFFENLSLRSHFFSSKI
jgi:hypothetical protein